MADPQEHSSSLQVDLGVSSDLVLKLKPSTEPLKPRFTLIGRILGDKTLNRGAVQTMIQKLWHFGGVIATSYLGPNLYSISTDCELSYHRILDESPWHFMGKFFNIKAWNPKQSIEEIDLESAAFWVQVHNLPPNYMTAENAPLIGSYLGKVLQFEESMYEGVLLRAFLRIRVLVSLDSPLKLGFWLHRDSCNKSWIKF